MADGPASEIRAQQTVLRPLGALQHSDLVRAHKILLPSDRCSWVAPCLIERFMDVRSINLYVPNAYCLKIWPHETLSICIYDPDNFD